MAARLQLLRRTPEATLNPSELPVSVRLDYYNNRTQALNAAEPGAV
jgi:hypothetical protein